MLSSIIYERLLTDRYNVHHHPVEQQPRRRVIKDKKEHDGHSVHHDFTGHTALLRPCLTDFK